MRVNSRIFLLISFLYAVIVCSYIAIKLQPTAHAQTNHIVISQIQISGTGNANEEFIELYNPTDLQIDLTGWRLSKKTATGTTFQNLVTTMSGSIAPHSYYLIVHPSSSFIAIADKVYNSATVALTTNNSLYLFSDAGITLVDKIGYGTAADFETAPFTVNPDVNQSILRKVTSQSTVDSLIIGGNEFSLGNEYDTENNANDFLLLPTSQPRNLLSPTARIFPTNNPTPTLFEFPTIQPTSIPTIEPTPIPTSLPSSTIEPTPTAIPTVTYIPSILPTTQPTDEPTLTPSPTPNLEPTELPIPTDILETITPPTPTQIPYPTPILPTVQPTKVPHNPKKGNFDRKEAFEKYLWLNYSLKCKKNHHIFQVHKYSVPILLFSCSLTHR